jgi:hypothetical protein
VTSVRGNRQVILTAILARPAILAGQDLSIPHVLLIVISQRLVALHPFCCSFLRLRTDRFCKPAG